jgi:hypothetical protein
MGFIGTYAREKKKTKAIFTNNNTTPHLLDYARKFLDGTLTTPHINEKKIFRDCV